MLFSLTLKHDKRIAFRYLRAEQAISETPVLLFHASPTSSESQLPLMFELARAGLHSVAFDTPGYGDSSGFTDQPTRFAPYLRRFDEALQQLNIQRCALFGIATGAQLALEFCKSYPAYAHTVMLDAACHFDDAQRDHLLEQYFPSLAPTLSGEHLNITWRICRRLFSSFPWFSEHSEDQLALSPPPLHVIHQFALAYWRAGSRYDYAYRLAFANEHAGQYHALPCPVYLVRRADSIVARHTDALLKHSLPAQVRTFDAPLGAATRATAIARHFAIEIASRLRAEQKGALSLERATDLPELKPLELDLKEDGSHLLAFLQNAKARYESLHGPVSDALELDAFARKALGLLR